MVSMSDAIEKPQRRTVGAIRIDQGIAVSELVEGAGATVETIFSVDVAGDSEDKRKIVIRFQGVDLGQVLEKLETAGYQVLESCEAVHGFGNAA